MSYPSWRIESWYDNNYFVGFRVVRGSPATGNFTVATDGSFRIDRGDANSKIAMRDLAMQRREGLTADESDPKVLAQEARDILREVLANSAAAPANGIIVPRFPLDVWLMDRLDRLCMVLNRTG